MVSVAQTSETMDMILILRANSDKYNIINIIIILLHFVAYQFVGSHVAVSWSVRM